ncbi:MAG: caspase family protein [Nannocystaceae bacterium]
MRRALLIGCQTHGLAGVHRDLDRMDQALDGFGFARTQLREADATRDGVLAGLRELIARSARDDAVMIYYSGHGGMAPNPGHSGAQGLEPRVYQYIVPTDHSREAFRGILTAELSALLAELTTRTRNVTCVFDCCHAANMLRGDRSYRPRALPGRPWAVGFDAHVAWLREQGYDLSRRGEAVESNPNALRLFACKASQSAYEYTDAEGRSGGVLTEALVSVLAEAEEAGDLLPSWEAVGAAVLARVHRAPMAQHPTVVGPRRRRLFALDAEERPDCDVFMYEQSKGNVHTLRAGHLHGVRVGERFLLMPLNAGMPDRDRAYAEAEATAVDGHRTHLTIERLPGRPPLPAGVRAFRHDARLARRLVRVSAADEALRCAVAEAPRLGLADDDAVALATVEAEAGALTVRDREGRRLRVARAGDEAAVVELLQQLARAQDLLELRSGRERAKLRAQPQVTWGRVVDGAASELPSGGVTLDCGERVYVRVTNTSRSPIYSSVFGVGVLRSIQLLSCAEPEGVELRPDETYVLGGDDCSGELVGLAVAWPAAVCALDTQPMALVIITIDQPTDLRALESDVLSAAQLFDERPVAHRDFVLPPSRPRVLRYAVQQIRLSVRPPPTDEAGER